MTFTVGNSWSFLELFGSQSFHLGQQRIPCQRHWLQKIWDNGTAKQSDYEKGFSGGTLQREKMDEIKKEIKDEWKKKKGWVKSEKNGTQARQPTQPGGPGCLLLHHSDNTHFSAFSNNFPWKISDGLSDAINSRLLLFNAFTAYSRHIIWIDYLSKIIV